MTWIEYLKQHKIKSFRENLDCTSGSLHQIVKAYSKKYNQDFKKIIGLSRKIFIKSKEASDTTSFGGCVSQYYEYKIPNFDTIFEIPKVPLSFYYDYFIKNGKCYLYQETEDDRVHTKFICNTKKQSCDLLEADDKFIYMIL